MLFYFGLTVDIYFNLAYFVVKPGERLPPMGWSPAITVRYPTDWSWSSSEGSFHPKLPPSAPSPPTKTSTCRLPSVAVRERLGMALAWSPAHNRGHFPNFLEAHQPQPVVGVSYSNYTEQLFSFPLFHIFFVPRASGFETTEELVFCA